MPSCSGAPLGPSRQLTGRASSGSDYASFQRPKVADRINVLRALPFPSGQQIDEAKADLRAKGVSVDS